MKDVTTQDTNQPNNGNPKIQIHPITRKERNLRTHQNEYHLNQKDFIRTSGQKCDDSVHNHIMSSSLIYKI